MVSSTTPSPATDHLGDGSWLFIHKRFLSEATEQEPDVVFIGDYSISSIGHSELWEKLFISMHCLNLGIEEDKTQNVLWRIENGELDNIKPKIIVISVGQNNYENTAEEVVEGIKACVEAISSRQPNAHIVVLKLLPTGPQPNPGRIKCQQVNEKLDMLASDWGKNVQVVDLDPGLVQPDGTISHHDMYDYRHLTRNAARRTFEPLADLLAQLLSEVAGKSSIGDALNDVTA